MEKSTGTISANIDKINREKREAIQNLFSKEEFKTAIRNLFIQGKKPKDITLKDIANILNITGTETQIRKEVLSYIRRVFSAQSIMYVLNTQYKFYLEDMNEEKAK